jgi:hypothetical protein
MTLNSSADEKKNYIQKLLLSISVGEYDHKGKIYGDN